jgi:hypothetical protein
MSTVSGFGAMEVLPWIDLLKILMCGDVMFRGVVNLAVLP